MVQQASDPQAWLALLRDKHILWNEARTAFLMYGVSGKQWVVMGEAGRGRNPKPGPCAGS
ncbi:MAG: phosphatidylglycerol lysyltransferase domain-containing protein [Asticcacaulis sp.]